MKNKYQSEERKSNHMSEVIGEQELSLRMPAPMAESWAEMQTKVEELAGQAGLEILRAILENEVVQRRYLVVIDGSKALRAGVERVFQGRVEVRHCRAPLLVRTLQVIDDSKSVVLRRWPLQNRTTTSLGLVGTLKTPPRSALRFTLAGTSSCAMGISRVHVPVLQ